MLLETLATQVESRREEFERQGYIFCKEFFSQDEISALFESIKSSDTPEKTFSLDQNKLKFHVDLLHRNRNIQALIAQAKVADLLSQVIGKNVWVRWNQSVSKEPGAGMMPWHQDNRYTNLKRTYYQLWIPLTKMTPENGGLCVQPGNYCFSEKVFPHRFSDGLYAYEGSPESPTFIEAEPGDIVIFSSFLLHCTTPNLTDQVRWSYVVECLPFEHFDPISKPPYFVISRNGKPQPEFIHFYRSRLNPIHFFKYCWFKLKNIWYCWLRPRVTPLLQNIGRFRSL